jgi:ABC-type glycerol-3-phosphate transport system substrate-binding protein
VRTILKHTVVVMLVATLMLTVFSSCVPQPGKEEESLSGSESSTITPSEQHLIISMYTDEQSSIDMMEEWFKVFETANPGITCELQLVSGGDYMTAYKTRFVAGDAPDVLFAKPRSFAEFINAGYIMDLTDEPFIHNIDPAIQNETTIDGRHWGIGLVARPKCVFYNMDIFEEHGLTIPTKQSEFWDLCDYFKNKGIEPLLHAYAYNFAAFTEHDTFFTSMALHHEEYDALSGVQAGTKRLADSKAFTESLKIYNKLVSYQDPGDFGIDQARSYQLFAAGSRPMFAYGGWIYGEVINNNPEGRFGIFPFPWSENPEENKMVVGIDYGLMGNAQSKYPDATLKFLEFTTTKEAGQILIDIVKLMSSIKGLKVSTDDPYIKSFNEYTSKDLLAAKYLVPEMTGEYSSVYRSMLQEYASLPSDQRDPEEYVSKMDAALAKIAK